MTIRRSFIKSLFSGIFSGFWLRFLLYISSKFIFKKLLFQNLLSRTLCFDKNCNLFWLDGNSFCFEQKTKMADFKITKFPEQKLQKISQFWREKDQIFWRNIKLVSSVTVQAIKSQIQRFLIFTFQQTFVTVIANFFIQWGRQWWWFCRSGFLLEFGDITLSSRTLWRSRRCKSQWNSRLTSPYLMPLLSNSKFLFGDHLCL